MRGFHLKNKQALDLLTGDKMAEMAQDFVTRQRKAAAGISSSSDNDDDNSTAALPEEDVGGHSSSALPATTEEEEEAADGESQQNGRAKQKTAKKKTKKKKKKKGVTVRVPHFQMKIDARSQTIKNLIVEKSYSTASLGSKRWIPKDPDCHLTSYPFGLRSFDFADVPH